MRILVDDSDLHTRIDWTYEQLLRLMRHRQLEGTNPKLEERIVQHLLQLRELKEISLTKLVVERV